MTAHVTGLIIFITTLAMYGVAMYCFTKSKIKPALFLVIVAGFILRVYVSSDNYLHPWDERYHALVAKNMISHPLTPTLYEDPVLPYDYKEWYSNHYWVHKQPMPLWFISASLQVFGINEFAVRIPGILLTTLGILLVYYIGNFFFNKRVAFISALLYSMNGLIIELTGGRVATDHYDTFFLFFIQLAVFFCIKFINSERKGYNILVGVAIGFAILTKWLPALIVLPIWFILVYDSGKFSKQQIFIQSVLLVFALVVVALPWQIYSARAFPLETAWEQYYNNLHLTDVLEGRSEVRWFFLERLRISYGDLIYLPLIWFTIQTLKGKFLNKQYALLIWVFIPVIFFTIAETKMQGYILFTAPALFIITGLFFDKINELKFSGFKRVFSVIVLALLILLPFRYCVERTKMLNPNTTSTEWVNDLKKLGETNHGKAILFNYPRPIEAMFYTDFIAYNTIPDIESLNRIQKQGYKIYFAGSNNLPDNIRANPDYQIVDMNDIPELK